MENIFLPERKKDSHKGTYGHLFVIGGSPGLTGAVCLSCLAALRTGCGMVTAGIPESLNDIFEIKLTEVMTKPLPESGRRTISMLAVEKCVDFATKVADGIVIGPGISTDFATEEFFKNFLPQINKPIVVDADGLKLLAKNLKILDKQKKIILTPHPGEMSHLTKMPIIEIQKNREKVAKDFAEKYGVVVVLKGYRTVISDGERIYINLTGNPGMATAGSGDVLSGIIGALVVQGFSLWDSAVIGTFLHGLAGDLAARKIGEYSLIAGDIIDFLPEAIRIIQKKS